MSCPIRENQAARGPATLAALTGLMLAPACLVEPICYDQRDCTPGYSCALPSGRCVQGECEAHTDCEPARYCVAGRCVACRGDQDCASGHCDGSRGVCVACTRDAECPSGSRCQDGRCVFEASLRCPDELQMAAIGDAFCIDRYEASRPDASAEHSGRDGSRATSRAGVLPWEVQSNAEARSACSAAGKDLCSAAQWALACAGPEGLAYAYGEVYEPSTCNGLDKGCRCGAGSSCASVSPCPFAGCFEACGGLFRLEPTGANPKCQRGGVYDLNGNLWEHIQGGDATQVRGGAHNCRDSQRYHRCDYVPGNWTPSALGFRCCWSPPP